MKHSFLLALILLPFITFAQEGFRIGPSLHYATSKPSVIDSLPTNFNFRFRSGFSGGVHIHYGFSPKFSISVGGRFVSKGYRVFNDTNNNGNVVKHNQNHIEIPVLISYKHRLNSVSFIRENIGMTFSQLMDSKSVSTSNDNGSFKITETNTKKLNPLLTIGLEVGNASKRGNVFLFGVYYKHSFSELTKLNVYNSKTSSTPYFNLNFKGSYLSLGATYLFKLNFKPKDEFFY